MKKIIFSALFATASLAVSAQSGSGKATANLSASTSQVSTNEEIRALANRLELNEYGYIRLRDLSKARNEQISEINSMYSNDAAMRQAKLNAVNKEFESGLAQSLTNKQFTAYLKMMGREPGTNGAGFEASGYGGQSLEAGATNSSGGAINEGTPANNTNSGVIEMKVDDDKVKLEDGANSMKIKSKKEKVETAEYEYKRDADEIKYKSKDGNYKAKSEPGKTKIETPSGKMKMEDGKVKMKTKDGKVISDL